MKKDKIIWLAVFVVVFVLGFILFYNLFKVSKNTKSTEIQPVGIETTTFTSEVFTFEAEGEQLIVQYSDDANKARIGLAGAYYELERAVSASGAKYEDVENAMVFWEHQGEVIFEIDGETVFESVSLSQEEDYSNSETSLENTKWQWQETSYADDKVVIPNEPTLFVLSFDDEERFSATTDCNNLFGNYEENDNLISFGQIASTKKACPDIESQEIEFAMMLSEVDSYLFTDEDKLILTLKTNSGSILLSPVLE